MAAALVKAGDVQPPLQQRPACFHNERYANSSGNRPAIWLALGLGSNPRTASLCSGKRYF